MKAVVFDAYGTLFDVQSVLAECERLFPSRGAEVSRLWRQKQLEYSWLRSLMDRYEAFDQVTEDALRHACAALGLTLEADGSAALMAAYRRLTPYAEVPAALTALAGRSLAILSNGSPAMLDDVVRNAGLQHYFEAVLSVDPLRVFKPHPRVYQSAVDRLGVGAADIAFVSSNFWDIAGATAFGFRTFWINRADMAADRLGVTPAGMLQRLDQLPDLLG
jgi:2-haloacid dehalogenase